MADISIEVNEINVVSVENMADISIEVNEINVVSVERRMMPFELIASIS